MPKKTIYVRDEDAELFALAEKKGGNLSAALADALRLYLNPTTRETKEGRRIRRLNQDLKTAKILIKAYRAVLRRERSERSASEQESLGRKEALKRSEAFLNSPDHIILTLDDYGEFLLEDEHFPKMIVEAYREPISRYISGRFGWEEREREVVDSGDTE